MAKTTNLWRCALWVGLLCGAVLGSAGCQSQATSVYAPEPGLGASEQVVADLQLTELARALPAELVQGILGQRFESEPEAARQARAVLEGMNLVAPDALSTQLSSQSLEPARLSTLDHSSLLGERSLLAALGQLLSDGVITGYDLREREVFAGVPQARTLIYSHSSPRHVRQLEGLLQLHGLSATVRAVPKVSAFLYREGWGGDGAHVVQLPNGPRVVQGREAAVAFVFAQPSDRLRFHNLVLGYAKRDAADEAGLLADAWWQPFYYSATPLAEFEEINLLIVSTPSVEATLTVLQANTAAVARALAAYPFDVETRTVWVNPAFYRFLGGDFR